MLALTHAVISLFVSLLSEAVSNSPMYLPRPVVGFGVPVVPVGWGIVPTILHRSAPKEAFVFY